METRETSGLESKGPHTFGPTRMLQALLAEFPAFRYPAGQIIVPRDDGLDSVFFLVSGIAKIRNRLPDSRETVYGVLGAGECFGICPLLGRTRSWGELVSLTAVEVIRVPSAVLPARMGIEPTLALELLGSLCSVVETITLRIDDRHHPPSLRLWRVMEELARKWSQSCGGGGGLQVPNLSHAELAALTGLARETVSRSLSRLQRERRLEKQENGWLLVPGSAAEGRSPENP